VIAAAKQNASHVAKVTAFIEQQTKLHPEAPRILYGKGHDNQLLALQVQMNAEALTLLQENPNIVSFGDGRMKTGPLIDAARTAAYAGGFSLAKGFSRATGLAGQLAPRSTTSKAAFTSPGVSKLASGVATPTLPAFTEVKQRVTSAVRNSEIELLPRRINDLDSSLSSMRDLQTDLTRRGAQADLREAVTLGEKIATKQTEVRAPPPYPHLPAPSCPMRPRALFYLTYSVCSSSVCTPLRSSIRRSAP
jgi:hypothetical protein